MACYVDTMKASFRGMRCCHLLADTHEELMGMAARLGLKPTWLQQPGTHREHFDLALSKRTLALTYGAQVITMKEAGRMIGARRETLRRQQELSDR